VANFKFTVSRNDISPMLSAIARISRHPAPVFRAMGMAFKSISEGNFNSAGMQYRPAPWPAKKDGSPATLKKSGLLWHSFHLTVSDQGATLSNPTPYAARHQFGDRDYVAGVKQGVVKTKYANRRYKGSWQDVMSGSSGMPPRPFVPVDSSGRLTAAAYEVLKAAAYRAIMRQY
jgi:phage gpG-like protein